MIPLDPETVIEINKSVNNTETPWVNKDLLYSAFSSYGYYEDPLEQFCAIYRGLIKNHAFSDGNKRTAVIVLTAYLNQHNYRLSSEDLCDLTLDVATHNYEVSEITEKLLPLIHKVG